MSEISSEPSLVGLALALGARSVGEWSTKEVEVAKSATRVRSAITERVRAEIESGNDPLGEIFCVLRTPVERREDGATYTPKPIVEAMTRWARRNIKPARIVDAGAGSGRFLVAAGRAFKHADLLGVEIDPVAAIVARGHLAAAGLAGRARVQLADYRDLTLEASASPTLFIGNPPYVRHHRISPEWKKWLTSRAADHGLGASQLAGLHVYFFLATAALLKPGDAGVFITAAEWLDVNYGKLVRDLFLGGLGGEAIHLIEPAAMPFADAATTAVITCFKAGSLSKSVAVRTVADADALGTLEGGRLVRRERLDAARRWTPLMRAPKKVPEGFIELGELFNVHRGQVTGANRVWIEGMHSRDLPDSVLFASVTKARELLKAGRELADGSALRRVIDLPVDLDVFDRSERKAVDRFLKIARSMGGDKGYVAEHRKAWWSIGLRVPAPILTTYMARRAPAFVLNRADARHINIAHGIYPRERLSANVLEALAQYLNAYVSTRDGRTYAGGLTKFEPKGLGGGGARPSFRDFARRAFHSEEVGLHRTSRHPNPGTSAISGHASAAANPGTSRDNHSECTEKRSRNSCASTALTVFPPAAARRSSVTTSIRGMRTFRSVSRNNFGITSTSTPSASSTPSGDQKSIPNDTSSAHGSTNPSSESIPSSSPDSIHPRTSRRLIPSNTVASAMR
ncbi:MAG: N-6 DNA methylase [Acidobacteriota bacterium]|nr:N-6 DNA methylase [Acidobacteriota bacterium]